MEITVGHDPDMDYTVPPEENVSPSTNCALKQDKLCFIYFEDEEGAV